MRSFQVKVQGGNRSGAICLKQGAVTVSRTAVKLIFFLLLTVIFNSVIVSEMNSQN